MIEEIKKCNNALNAAFKGDYSLYAPEESTVPEIAELSKLINKLIKSYKDSMEDAMEMAIVIYQYVEAFEKIIKGNYKISVPTDSRIDVLNTLGRSINESARSIEKMILIEKLLQEVSTPCLKLWDEIVAMPIIGTLTSKRA